MNSLETPLMRLKKEATQDSSGDSIYVEFDECVVQKSDLAKLLSVAEEALQFCDFHKVEADRPLVRALKALDTQGAQAPSTPSIPP